MIWKTWAVLQSSSEPTLVPVEIGEQTKSNFTVMLTVDNTEGEYVVGEIIGDIGQPQQFFPNRPFSEMPTNDCTLDEWLEFVRDKIKGVAPDSSKTYILVIDHDNPLR